MRYLILSDIHSNLEALEAVLAAAARQYDAVLSLGDVVGYGADPNAVVEKVRALKPVASIRGNHDKVAAGLDSSEDFNSLARAAALWTQRTLSPSNLEYVRGLAAGPAIVDADIEICHGSPLDEDFYIVADVDAAHAIGAAKRRLCFFGHTHVAMCGRMDGRRRIEIQTPDGQPELEVSLDDGVKYLINPGSVGQPRDGDARAAYAVVDLKRGVVRLQRVAYPIEVAQKKILEAGLPPPLAYRLGMGR